MSERTENVKQVIDSLTPEELASLVAYLRAKLPKHDLELKWGIDADVILGAIYRSADITQRGVRGVVAEAVFEQEVLPRILERGWKNIPVKDQPYDFAIENQSINRRVTIQVKLQRTERGEPKLMKSFHPPSTYVVEVQKTRTGVKRKPKGAAAAVGEEDIEIKTRPYQFGEFDILAVNMQPSTKNWSKFLYTVSSWLLPDAENAAEIDTFQPIVASIKDVWTEDIEECIKWFLSGEKKRIFDIEAAKAEHEKVTAAAREAKNAEREKEKQRRKTERVATRAMQKAEKRKTTSGLFSDDDLA
jgi:hypothetical protein